MDLFGPMRTASFFGKRYYFFIVDDYSKFIWLLFLSTKDDTIHKFKVFSKKVQNEKGYCMSTIKSNRGGEFLNDEFERFYDQEGITHQLSAPKTPQ